MRGSDRSKSAGKTRRAHPLADLEEASGILEDMHDAPAKRRSKSLKDKARQRQRKDALDTLQDLAASMTSNLDQRSLVRQILECAAQTLGAERGILFLGKRDDMILAPAMAIDISGEELKEIEGISRTILAAGRDDEILVTEDASKDDRFKDAPSVALSQIRSVICAPLKIRGEALGVIYLDAPSQTWPVPEGAREFIASFSGLAAAALKNAHLHGELLRENARLRRRLDSSASFERLLGLSARMGELLKRASLAAQVDAPILILGEPGSGKELLARAIHQAGSRVLNPFVSYNCGSMPRDLMERVLFGHTRGSHTGSQRSMPGLFPEADRGTLFLNEVGDLDPTLQERLLRAITDGVILTAGTRRETRVDVHVITASSRNLRDDVREHRFSQELYYALNVQELMIPPLRDRPEDIPLLVDHFLQKHAPDAGGLSGVTFTPDALRYLQGLAWRGNVRELESLVRQVLVTTDRPKVDATQLESLVAARLESASPLQVPGAWPAPGRSGEVRPFKEQERELLREALIRAGGNKSKAARLLGLHRNTFLRRLKKLKVTVED